ncbi:exonuclease SbcCD subunit D [Sporolactobacillus sp. THM7-4]|nr:exonuclease SbcCD subunit D [Sporolactobacillus sp. THM7-4]
MRLLHTADWHLGRTLEGRSRQEEQEAVMEEICRIAENEQIDAVLMAGDVFDTVNPPAVSEALFYETAERLANGGDRPLIIIAGNHDSPERLEASRPLAGRQGITIIGRPGARPLDIPVKRTDERLVLSSVPYPSESRLNECLSEMNDEEAIQEAYNDRLAYLFSRYARHFAKDAVNILMTHLFTAGGKESDSERPVQVGGAYTVYPSSFPEEAQYVALGHLHRPQTIGKAPVLTRYAGSPLAYSFSEAGHPKSVTIVDVQPGEKASVEEIFLTEGRPLVRWRAENGLDDVYRWLDEGRDCRAWIDLEICLHEALSMHDIQALRKACNRFVTIRPVYMNDPEEEAASGRSQLPIDQLFIRFYKQQEEGAEPGRELIRLFLQLIEEDDAAREAAAAGSDKHETD